MPHETSAPKTEKSGRLFAYASGSFVLGLIGHGLQRAVPDSWRGNGEIWDFWSHIGNVPDSVLVVSGVTMITAIARRDLFRATTPFRRAASTAACGLALGLGMNAVYDAPIVAETAIVQQVFGSGEAEPLDLPYGGVAAIAEAGLLAWAGSKRSSNNIAANIQSTNMENK